MADVKEYGTIAWYAEQFSDILADAQADTPKYGDAIVTGFLKALDEWLTYHADQVDEYKRLGERVRTALSV